MRFLGSVLTFLLLIALTAGCGRHGSDQKVETGVAAAKPAAEAKKVAVPASTTNDKVAASILPREPTVGDDLRVVVPGGAAIKQVEWYRNGTPVGGEGNEVLPAHSFLKGEEVSAEVTTDLGTAWAAVNIGNTPPRVVSADFIDPHVHAGQPIEIEPRGEDEDGDAVAGYRCVWAVNGEIIPDQVTTVLPPDYFKKGDGIVVEVIASDGEEEGPPFVGKEFIIPNAPPVFVSEPPEEFSSKVYVYQARAEDPDGDPLTFRLEAAPAGMTMDEEGNISWTLDSSSAGEHRVRIVAEDNEGAKAVQEYTLRVSLPEGGGR